MSALRAIEGKNIFDIYMAWDRGTSASGRPINELEASEPVKIAATERGIITEKVACPYSGSRYGKIMNRSALVDMALSNQDSGVVNGLAWINGRHLPGRIENPIRRSAALDITNTGVGLSLYVTHRAEDPYAGEGEVPDVIANITKASKGLQAAVGELFVSNPSGLMPTGSELYKYVEGRGMLVRKDPSGEEHACAAPEKMFTEAADALYARKSIDPKASVLERDIKDFTSLRMFGDIFFVSIEQSLGFNNVIREAIFYGLKAKTERGRVEVAEQYKTKEARYLQQCAEMQKLMNQALGRDPLSARKPATSDLQMWLGKDSEVLSRFLEFPKDFLLSLPT